MHLEVVAKYIGGLKDQHRHCLERSWRGRVARVITPDDRKIKLAIAIKIATDDHGASTSESEIVDGLGL